MKDLSRLVLRQYTNDKNTRCFCLHCCNSEEVLKNSWERCKLHRTKRIKLPEADNKNERDKANFTKTEYHLRLTFVMYADFERVQCKQDSCVPSSSKSFTTQYQHHVPCGSCIYMKGSDGQYFEALQVNIGDGANEKFFVPDLSHSNHL